MFQSHIGAIGYNRSNDTGQILFELYRKNWERNNEATESQEEEQVAARASSLDCNRLLLSIKSYIIINIIIWSRLLATLIFIL